jgi:hypothetical protein
LYRVCVCIEHTQTFSTHILPLFPPPPHLGGLAGGAVLLPLALLLLLLQLLDALLQDVGPEVALKVWQLFGAGEPVLRGLFEDVLQDRGKTGITNSVGLGDGETVPWHYWGTGPPCVAAIRPEIGGHYIPFKSAGFLNQF